jgi:hypothetical protein
MVFIPCESWVENMERSCGEMHKTLRNIRASAEECRCTSPVKESMHI